MTVPHGDNVAGFAALRPDHNDQASVEMAGSDEPRLAVIEAVIDNCCRQSGKQLTGPCKIESAVLKRQIAFRRIECNLHQN
jgi:hypothetical protein